MNKNDVIKVNQLLLCYSNKLMGNWYPCHGESWFERALTCAEGRPRLRYYKHSRYLPSLSQYTLDNWSCDIEHGIFHGLMAGFIGFLYRPDDFQYWIADFLLHDLLKCSEDDKDHDSRLSEFFCLHPETYRHSNPSIEDIKSPIVVADRVELMRFTDHPDWLDRNMLEDSLPWDIIDTHYRCIRPHLEKIFLDRCDIWVRHFDETGWMIDNARINNKVKEREDDGCYPRNHWCPIGEYFAIDIGRIDSIDSKANRLLNIDKFLIEADHCELEDRTWGLTSRRLLVERNTKIRPSLLPH